MELTQERMADALRRMHNTLLPTAAPIVSGETMREHQLIEMERELDGLIATVEGDE